MIPETIGGYQIIGELGRGAMGVVYHAHDPRIGRPVAIKVIRIDPCTTEEQGAQLRQRLIREASAAGKLSHPGIVTIYHLGEEGQDVFVVMEFVQGHSLEHFLTGRMERRRVVEILRQVAEALDYAHAAGVVHRDIKPANILVREDGCIKVADFGIAKLTEAATQGTTSGLTIAGACIGSPAYMSPEQVKGQAVDGRTDQFSFAIMAFEMLTGHRPFSAASTAAVLYQILNVDPLESDDVSVLSPREAAALRRGLAKNPEDRFPTCAALVNALSEEEEGETVVARPTVVRDLVSPSKGIATGTAAEAVMPSRTSPVPKPEPMPQIAAESKPTLVPPPVAQPRKSRAPLIVAGAALLLILLAVLGYWQFHGKQAGAPEAASPATAASSTPAPASASPAAPVNQEVPLVKAILEGRLEDARALIAKGANVNAAIPDGTTALMQAAQGSPYMANNAAAVTMLLDAKAQVDVVDKQGRTALFRAVSEGKDDAVRLLLARKADPNHRDNNGFTPLLTAVGYGKIGAAQMLLDNGAQIDLADTQGNTPLMQASEGTPYMPNNAPLVQLLLDHQAKVDAADNRGRTALYRASAEGKTDAMRLLLDRKADPNQRATDGTAPLIEAVQFGKSAAVDLLLARGATVDLADSNGSTPLQMAAEGSPYMPNNAPMVTTLLAAHAKVDAQDNRGRTPLYRAAAEGKEEAMAVLLARKADPNHKANDATTPLIEAVMFGKTGAAKLLLEHGADANLADSNGTTPLMVVADGGPYLRNPKEMIDLLLSHKAKPGQSDARGRTALARATENKNAAAIEVLNGK